MRARSSPPDERIGVDAVGFSSQRDTFVPVTTAGEPIGRAIASADRRATEEAAGLGEDFHVLTGVVPDAGAVAAKVAWIRRHEPDRLSGGQRWILGPRDLIAFRLTGRGDHRLLGRFPDRTDRSGRSRTRWRRAPSGDRRPDHDHREHAPRRGHRTRRESGNTRRGRRRRSSVRGARRRGHDRPSHGVLGNGRRRVGARRPRAGAGSRHRGVPRRARRLRDGGGSSVGRLGPRVARPADGPFLRRAHATSRRHRRRRRRLDRPGVVGRGPGAVVGRAHRSDVRGAEPRAHRGAPGPSARRRPGVRCGSLSRSRGTRRG